MKRRRCDSANKAAHSSFETRRRRHQKSKTRVSLPHKKDLCPPKISMEILFYNFYRPQRSCEGYVFTRVCLSTGGVCPSGCWDTHPPGTKSRHPPGPKADTPPGTKGRNPWTKGKYPPQDQRQTPPVCPQEGSAPVHAGIHTHTHTPGTKSRHPPGPKADTPPGTKGRNSRTKGKYPPPGPKADTPCLSTGGVCPSACWDTHPLADTPCLSTGGVCPSACWDTHTLDQKQTPPRTKGLPNALRNMILQADTPWTKGRHPPGPKADNPGPKADPPKTKSRHPPDQKQTPPPGIRLLLRTVRILLECILVTI